MLLRAGADGPQGSSALAFFVPSVRAAVLILVPVPSDPFSIVRRPDGRRDRHPRPPARARGARVVPAHGDGPVADRVDYSALRAERRGRPPVAGRDRDDGPPAGPAPPQRRPAPRERVADDDQ